MKFVVLRTATSSASFDGCGSFQGGVCVEALEDEAEFVAVDDSAVAFAASVPAK